MTKQALICVDVNHNFVGSSSVDTIKEPFIIREEDGKIYAAIQDLKNPKGVVILTIYKELNYGGHMNGKT